MRRLLFLSVVSFVPSSPDASVVHSPYNSFSKPPWRGRRAKRKTRFLRSFRPLLLLRSTANAEHIAAWPGLDDGNEKIHNVTRMVGGWWREMDGCCVVEEKFRCGAHKAGLEIKLEWARGWFWKYVDEERFLEDLMQTVLVESFLVFPT